MQLKVTQISFDFTDDYHDRVIISEDLQNKVTNSVLGNVYTVEDVDDLVDAISDEVGWCVLSIDYQEV